MSDGAKQIQYSERYYDDKYEYRHVVLPEEINKLKESMYKGKLLTEDEWRGLGVQQSRGWVHYAIHSPELHIMLFRRPKNYEQLVASGQLAPHAPSQRVAV